jgi:biopolymer transport protein ExbD
MSRFNKDGGREMPEMNTSSLPDLIFSILFFFMMVTTMREVTLKVKVDKPQGTQLEKLVRKSATSFVYMGKPVSIVDGSGTKVQINDKLISNDETFYQQVTQFILDEQGKLAQSDKPYFTVSMKVDHDTPMGFITDLKQVLRKAYALKIVYSANKIKSLEE